MKQSIFIVILFALLSESGFSQIPISPVPISVGYSKTTSLIFTYPIVLVDIGSAAVLGKIPKRTSNILELKATSKNFAQTNASVVTSDGQFYAFTLNFGANADSL